MHHIDVEKARREMASRGLDVLIAGSVNNVYYCTGYYSQNWGEMRDRPRFAVVPKDSKPFVVCADAEAASYAKSGVFEIFEHHTKAYFKSSGNDAFSRAEKHVRSIPELARFNAIERVSKAPIYLAAKVLSDRGLGSARIGIDKKEFGAADLEELTGALRGCQFTNASDLFLKLRSVKSKDELAYIRKAIEITEDAMTSATPLIKEGSNALKVQRHLAIAMSEENFAEPRRMRMTIDLSPSPVGETGAASEGRFKLGQVLRMDIGAKYREYKADFTRQWTIGDIPQAEKDIYAACMEANAAMVAKAHPGTRCCDIYRTGNEMIKKLDPDYGQRMNMGHSIGLEANEPPRIDPTTEDVLEPGMIICIEVPWYVPGGFRYNAEDQYFITETGHELLSKRIPLDLIYV